MERPRQLEQLTIEDLADATEMILAMALHGSSDAIRPGLYYALDAVVLCTRLAQSLSLDENKYLCSLLPVSGIERELLPLIDDARLSVEPSEIAFRCEHEMRGRLQAWSQAEGAEAYSLLRAELERLGADCFGQRSGR